MKPTLITGIDVGTTKTVTLIAHATEDVGLEVLGFGQYPSTGLRKGLVVDLDRTILAIEESRAQAERMAGERINKAYVGVTGAHLRTHPVSASVAVLNPEQGVANEDIARVLEQAKARDLGQNRKLISALVREYTIDGQEGIRNPRGVSGLKLGMQGLLVSGETTSLENLHRCATAAGLHVQEMFLEPVASAQAVLTTDEMDRGTVLVDIGGGTTDVAVYLDGAAAYVFVIPVGGDHFDSDLAYAFDMPAQQAEWLKVNHGSVRTGAFGSEKVAHLPWADAKMPVVAEKLIAEVVRPRAEELMDLIARELVATNLIAHMQGGLVLTGGGSLLDGLGELSHQRTGLTTRIGRPYGFANRREDLQAPNYATAVGLVKLAHRELMAQQPVAEARSEGNGFLDGLLGLVRGGARRFVSWVNGY